MSLMATITSTPWCIDVPVESLSLKTVIASTAEFIFAVLATGLWTHYHGPISGAARAIRWNSRVYAVISLVILVLIIQFSIVRYDTDGKITGTASCTRSFETLADPSVRTNDFSSYLQTKHTNTIALAPFIYHFSKFYEYLDINLVLANHGPDYMSLSQQPIDLHFAFHHLTTPYLTWFRIIENPIPGWEVFAALNSTHHSIMYLFFAGGFEGMGLKPEMLRKVLPWTGGLQLIAGIGMEVRAILLERTSSHSVLKGHWIAVGLLTSYLILYIRDLRQRAEVRRVETHEKVT